MDERIHAYLDGELPREALPAALEETAARWDRLTEATAALPADPAPAWLEGRIMAAISTPQPLPEGAPGRLWRWLSRPRQLTVRPITAAAGALALLALFVLPRVLSTPTPAPTLATNAAGEVYVQFKLQAPGAESVTVAGDFNAWKTDGVPLRDTDGDGVWTGMVPLSPGVHKYMFVVDGSRWETDPQANRYVDDGFGMRNALIAVTPPPRRAS